MKLLRTRRFLPFWLTLCLGALNDNLFKTGLVLYTAFRVGGREGDLWTVSIGGLFILPFCLFSGLAGQLADKYSPARLTYFIKLAEIGIMVCGALAFLFESLYGLLGVLFLMGAQSTFFGPIKYSILPRYLEQQELIGGNALVQGGTYLSILLGLLFSGFLLQAGKLHLISAAILLVALAGWATSRTMPPLEGSVPDLVLSRNLLRGIREVLRTALRSPLQRVVLVAIAWFWFIAASYVNVFPLFVRDHLGGQEVLVSALFACFAIGICIGCYLCNLFSAGRILPVMSVIGAAAISLAGLDLFFAGRPGHELIRNGHLLGTLSGWRLCLDLGLVAAAAGFYIVPLYALLQSHVPVRHRARVLAASGILDAFAVIASSVFCALLTYWMGREEIQMPWMFIVFGAVNLLFLIFLLRRAPALFLPHRRPARNSPDAS